LKIVFRKIHFCAADIFWYLNGTRLIQDERHRIIVNESGCHAMLITSAKLEDAGTISCLAKNGSGEAAFQVPPEADILFSPGRCLSPTVDLCPLGRGEDPLFAPPFF
jgi:hypothetical protein